MIDLHNPIFIIATVAVPLLIALALIILHWWRTPDCPENDPERDAGVEPEIIEAVCPQCAAAFANGWKNFKMANPHGLREVLCPDCHIAWSLKMAQENAKAVGPQKPRWS